MPQTLQQYWNYGLGANQNGQKVTLRKEQKSVELMVRLIETFTDPEDIICDPFMGTGTTLVAALYCKRRCVGMDIDATIIPRVQERLAKVIGLLNENKFSEVLQLG